MGETVLNKSTNNISKTRIKSQVSKDGFSKSIHPSSKEIKWSDVAHHFEPVSVTNTCDKSKSKCRVDQRKSSMVRNSLIFAPFCRQHDISLFEDVNEEDISEEDICDDTQLKEHQI